ncbi:MAG: hypothetical protein AAFZ52_16160 [Bacteroidota bacterium]
MTTIQYLTDARGTKTSVVIPMRKLLQLSEVIEELRKLEEISDSIRKGIKEAKAIEQGKRRGIPAEDFLNEL